MDHLHHRLDSNPLEKGSQLQLATLHFPPYHLGVIEYILCHQAPAASHRCVNLVVCANRSHVHREFQGAGRPCWMSRLAQMCLGHANARDGCA